MPESDLKNNTHTILWYFEIQRNKLIQARKPERGKAKREAVI